MSLMITSKLLYNQFRSYNVQISSNRFESFLESLFYVASERGYIHVSHFKPFVKTDDVSHTSL